MTKLLPALFCLALIQTPAATQAENARFAFLRTVSVGELNEILDGQRRDFIRVDEVLQPLQAGKGGLTLPPGYRLPPAAKASNAVDVYTVQYETTMPERGNQRAQVSGLLAIPRLPDRRGMPLLSYQHGTVYNTYAVPSYAFQASAPTPYDHRAESFETRYMVALFGGNGYAVMAADLVGMGVDAGRNPEAYMIKRVSAQANVDLYRDVVRHLASLKIVPANLYLGGWSQGGYNTTAFLQQLEGEGVRVAGAFTASAPNDPLAAMNAFLFHPLASDTKYFAPLLGQMVFACEAHGGPDGLAKAMINPSFYAGLKSIYERTYGSPPGDYKVLFSMIDGWQNQPRPSYLKPEFRAPGPFAASGMGQCLSRNEAYRQEFKTELRMYYGSIDPIIRPSIGRLASSYQLAIKGAPEAASENRVKAILVNGGSHRLTFITGSVEAKAWMDQQRGSRPAFSPSSSQMPR